MIITKDEINEYIDITKDKISILEDKESEINLKENTIENQKANLINLQDLKDSYENENISFKQDKSEIEKRLHTNDRKIYYENNENKKLIFYNLIFSYILWFTLGVLVLLLLYKGKILDLYFWIRVAILLLIYYFGSKVVMMIIYVIQAFLNYFRFVYYNM